MKIEEIKIDIQEIVEALKEEYGKSGYRVIVVETDKAILSESQWNTTFGYGKAKWRLVMGAVRKIKDMEKIERPNVHICRELYKLESGTVVLQEVEWDYIASSGKELTIYYKK